jgi:hypothetical protein
MRIRRTLKRCTSAVLITVMLALGVGISVIDAHAVSAGPHFDAPADASCSSPQHDHSLCEFLAATPVLGTTSGLPELALARESKLGLPESERFLPSAAPLQARSRSPPID